MTRLGEDGVAKKREKEQIESELPGHVTRNWGRAAWRRGKGIEGLLEKPRRLEKKSEKEFFLFDPKVYFQ